MLQIRLLLEMLRDADARSLIQERLLLWNRDSLTLAALFVRLMLLDRATLPLHLILDFDRE